MDIKNVIVVVIFFGGGMLISCGTVKYYVYDEDGSREGYPEGYCTFEVHSPKGRLIYRGYSTMYGEFSESLAAPLFAYIEGEGISVPETFTGFVFEPKELQIKYQSFNSFFNPDGGWKSFGNIDRTIFCCEEKLGRNLEETLNQPDKSITYRSTFQSDSLVLSDSFGKLAFFERAISWFPPYVKLTPKIDYKQFRRKEDLGINYKDPIKTSGGWGAPYLVPDKMPRFQPKTVLTNYSHDYYKFQDWVKEQIVYPDSILKTGIKGWVTIYMVVQKDGTLKTFGTLSSGHIPEGFASQLQDIVNRSPRWKPARERGRKVRAEWLLNFNFDIPDNNNRIQ